MSRCEVAFWIDYCCCEQESTVRVSPGIPTVHPASGTYPNDRYARGVADALVIFAAPKNLGSCTWVELQQERRSAQGAKCGYNANVLPPNSNRNPKTRTVKP